jgi:hypothetical protein
MASSSEARNGRRTTLSKAEARALFDEQSRRYLNMSAEEFARRYDADELDPSDWDVAYLALVREFAS